MKSAYPHTKAEKTTPKSAVSHPSSGIITGAVIEIFTRSM
jgi:hypothetical protein